MHEGTFQCFIQTCNVAFEIVMKIKFDLCLSPDGLVNIKIIQCGKRPRLLFDSHEECESVMISVGPASRVVWGSRNFSVEIF